ncbi:hypothetical protein [Streptomyces sp900105755]|uniref:Uncharacterized protein n=1 Tax=Streptomyces sp. 900105755 TaxID=3154389 RepID=A0ABV1T859_9ACTN
MTSKTRVVVTGAPGTREPCTARETRDTREPRDTPETRDTRETREAPVPRAGDEERRPYRRVPPAAVRLIAVRLTAVRLIAVRLTTVPPGRRHTPEATARPRRTPTGPGGGPLLPRLPHLPLLLDDGGS